MTDQNLSLPNVGAPAPVTPPAPATPPTPPPAPTPVVTTQQVGKYTVKVIREKCISAGSCVAIAPQTFQLDEAGIAVVLSQTGNDPETQLLGAQSCPTAAIEVYDNQTGEKVWPK